MIDLTKLVKMKNVNSSSHKRSTLNGDHHDTEYNETLSQMYNTVLTSLDHRAVKANRKNSIFRRMEPDDVEPKSDNSSTSTASSDGSPRHHYEAFEAVKTSDQKDTPASFLGGAIKGYASELKRGVVVRLQRWKSVRGCKSTEVFLHEARYPSEVRSTC